MQQEIIQCNCCGCGACALKCPKQAITMRQDNMGFLIPVIDNQLLIVGYVKRCVLSRNGRNINGNR